MSRFAVAPGSPIANLSSAFQTFVGEAATFTPFGATGAMEGVEKKLRENIQPGTGLPDKYICRAVLAFRAKGADRLTAREVRALCAGLNHACIACNGPALMTAAPDVANEIIARIARGFREKQLHAESWYDLLQCYLGAKERSVCCEMVRGLLADTLSMFDEIKGYPFAWLKVLQASRSIFDEQPCKAAAQQSLQGNTAEIESLRKSLPIPDSSWFWRELTVARAALALELDDAGFIKAVPGLLQAAHFLPMGLRDQILRQFLDRGVKCRELNPQEELKAFAVDAWGAPPLGADGRYDLVSPAARALVQESLIRDDMKDFMTLLQPDERKLAFWNRYLKSIEYHRVLVGPDGQRSPQPAVAQLRTRPSAAKLVGCPDGTNAFLMKIGGWLIVESTGAESPIYGYRVGALPFKPEAGEIDLPCLRKNGAADFKLKREDTLEGMWEDKLVTELATLGIRREEVKKAKPGAPAAKPQAAAPKETAPALDEAAFNSLMLDLHIQAEDTRKQGGALWIGGDAVKENYYLAQRLAALGFRWKAGRGWWRY